MKAKVYIANTYAGNFANGNGQYIVTLEATTRGEPVTRSYAKKYINTTNNRIVLLAVIEALEHFKKPCEIAFYTTSKYVVENCARITQWKQDNWKHRGKDVKNMDLWKKVKELSEGHVITMTHVEEHEYFSWQLTELKTKHIDLEVDNRR